MCSSGASGCACVRRAARRTRCRVITRSRRTCMRASRAPGSRTVRGPLFRTIARGTRTGQLSDTPLPQANAYAMVRRRALAAGIGTKIGNHTFRATGITAYLKNGGTLENAAAMANHASTRTTQLYDRRHDEISLDEVERIRAACNGEASPQRGSYTHARRGSNVADRPIMIVRPAFRQPHGWRLSSVLRAVQPPLILKGEEDGRALVTNRKQGMPPTRAPPET
ncbi:phage integrase family protein [Burkholderia pseudomallei]|nr:phage integrase family protein [Burkholderia pseudomallei]